MSRGDIVTIALSSELRQKPLFLIEVAPTSEINLKRTSQVMVDKIQAVPCEKVGSAFGHLDETTMLSVNRALALWPGFA